MTDSIHGLTVSLDRDYREDDVQTIIQAIRMVKGVSSVSVHTTDMPEHFARERVFRILRGQIENAMQNIFDDARLNFPEGP